MAGPARRASDLAKLSCNQLEIKHPKRMASEPEILDSVDEATESIPFTYSIASYGADYPVDSLIKRISNGDILVPTFEHEEKLNEQLDPFQREYVWPRSKADRFIESLLLGLPVPGIFLVKEDSGRLLVLDGHQRLFTLQCFYQGVIDKKEYSLNGIQERFAGKTYKDLDVEDRRRLDDSIIHATIVKQEEPSEDWSSIYNIFERLNTGGVTLQPQEIRMALYHGPFASFLREANAESDWRALIGPVSRRLKDIELILRFFALLYQHQAYQSPMKDFLNKFMAKNKSLSNPTKDELLSIFRDTTNLIYTTLGINAFRPERSVNAALVDALMTGVAAALRAGKTPSAQGLLETRKQLLAESDFLDAITTGTSQKPKVDLRVSRAIAKVSENP